MMALSRLCWRLLQVSAGPAASLCWPCCGSLLVPAAGRWETIDQCGTCAPCRRGIIPGARGDPGVPGDSAPLGPRSHGYIRPRPQMQTVCTYIHRHRRRLRRRERKRERGSEGAREGGRKKRERERERERGGGGEEGEGRLTGCGDELGRVHTAQ